jgi:hypothetical protein
MDKLYTEDLRNKGREVDREGIFTYASPNGVMARRGRKQE